MLVPEIALTPQVVKEFCSLFGQQVTVIHSELSLGQRADAYKRIKNGDVKSSSEQEALSLHLLKIWGW